MLIDVGATNRSADLPWERRVADRSESHHPVFLTSTITDWCDERRRRTLAYPCFLFVEQQEET